MAYHVIFGAGKIARGFIAQLLFLNGQDFVFVEKNQSLVDLINQRREYTVHVLGAPEKNAIISGLKAVSYKDADQVADVVSKASTIFTAVGGKNLDDLVPFLVKGLQLRFLSRFTEPVNIITCENWKSPARQLRESMEENLDDKFVEEFRNRVGIAEAVIMRSGIEPDEETQKKDPLAVNVSNYWEMPVDGSALKGHIPEILGIKPMLSFGGFLERKFYTYNAANGTVSYLGYVKGYERLADAAHDKEILEILMGVYDETSRALCQKHKFPLEEQMAFTKTSLNKLQDYAIVDSIERNARDPIRKLGPDDRLVGSARLVLDWGIVPVNLAAAIAAAIYYDNPVDSVALQLKKIREEKGIDYILENICKIEKDSILAVTVKEKVEELHKKGWIK